MMPLKYQDNNGVTTQVTTGMGDDEMEAYVPFHRPIRPISRPT